MSSPGKCMAPIDPLKINFDNFEATVTRKKLVVSVTGSFRYGRQHALHTNFSLVVDDFVARITTNDKTDENPFKSIPHILYSLNLLNLNGFRYTLYSCMLYK